MESESESEQPRRRRRRRRVLRAGDTVSCGELRGGKFYLVSHLQGDVQRRRTRRVVVVAHDGVLVFDLGDSLRMQVLHGADDDDVPVLLQAVTSWTCVSKRCPIVGDGVSPSMGLHRVFTKLILASRVQL